MVNTTEQIITKEEFDEFMKVEGTVAGAGIKEYMEFILQEEGKEGVKKLEDVMVKFGYPRFREIKIRDYYPIGFYTFVLLAIKRLFNYDDEKFQEIGRFNAKFSIVIRLFMRFFVSMEKAAKEVPRMWRKYYTIGDLKTVEYDIKKKYSILRLENFSIHPFHCHVCKGYFSAILKMIVKNKVTCQETKCVHRGDEYHEFLLKW